MKVLPDLWDDCYTGEHRKLLAPEQFKQMFCNVCLNPGCRNSKGADTQWVKRMLTQEDRLLNSPAFADPGTAERMGLPDFQDRIREALVLEISAQRGDWEVVSEAEVGQAAAEMLGMTQPAGFQQQEPLDPTASENPEVKPESDGTEPIGHWRMKGTGKDADGKRVIYDVTQYEDGHWECTCPSRQNPCKHVREIDLKLSRAPQEAPPSTPPPAPVPRQTAPSSFMGRGMNTATPSGGIMVGGAAPEPESDPWAPPEKKDERVVEVGGRVTFGSRKKK